MSFGSVAKWFRREMEHLLAQTLFLLVSSRRVHLVGDGRIGPYDIDVTHLRHPGPATILDPSLVYLVSEVARSYWEIIARKSPVSRTLRNLSLEVPEINDFSNHHFLLWSLANVRKPKKVLEFGTASGTSLASFLCEPTVQHIVTLDLLGIAENTSWVSPQSRSALMDHLHKNSSRWSQVVTDAGSLRSLKDVIDCPDEIDLVFVDIGHDGVVETNLVRLFEKELRPGTLVVWDDIALGPMVGFWDQLTWSKANVGSMGHYSGTGLSLVPEANG